MLKIHDAWCTKQQQDFEIMMQAVDDLGASALALASGGAQSYSQFVQTRDQFKTLYLEVSKHYRYVDAE